MALPAESSDGGGGEDCLGGARRVFVTSAGGNPLA